MQLSANHALRNSGVVVNDYPVGYRKPEDFSGSAITVLPNSFYLSTVLPNNHDFCVFRLGEPVRPIDTSAWVQHTTAMNRELNIEASFTSVGIDN